MAQDRPNFSIHQQYGGCILLYSRPQLKYFIYEIMELIRNENKNTISTNYKRASKIPNQDLKYTTLQIGTRFPTNLRIFTNFL